MITLIINIVICLVTMSIFLFVLKIQFKLKHNYNHNGFVGIRIANILTTLCLMFLTLFRAVYFFTELTYSGIHYHSEIQLFIFYFNSIFMFIISVINYMFYTGNNFNFLTKKHNEKETNL